MLKQSTTHLVIKNTDRMVLLTILSGVISGCVLIFGIANGFSMTLGLIITIFALMGGISARFPGVGTTCVLDKHLAQLTITTEFLFFRRTQHHQLQEIVSVNVGLLTEALPKTSVQQYRTFSNRQFLYLKLASGKIVLLKTLDLHQPDELKYHQQVAEQIQAFLNI